MPDLLVEIGAEELPPRRVRAAAEALRDGLAAALAAEGLLDGWKPDGQAVLGTPRRLAAFLAGVKDRRPDRAERVWGPTVAAGFGPDGKPTRACEGFTRSAGVRVEDLKSGEKAAGKPPYLYADRVVPGCPAAEVVAEVLPRVVASLPFRRTMRWPQSDLPFARPVRNLVVLLGTEVVPCRLAGVEAGRATRGHPFLRPGSVEIPSADLEAYRALLRGARVIVDFGERASSVERQVRRARAKALGSKGRGPWFEADRALLEEVAGLVEWPRALVGSFDERYRSLPAALLATAMAHHLRYFPVCAPDESLLAKFVSVTDREARHAAGIRGGNERVLRARLGDAAYSFESDRRRRLEDFRPGLAGVDFHRGLGTLLEKSERVRKIAVSLCDALSLPGDARACADHAAYLLKCDLLTEVVKEFPELQGVVGAHYASLDGEPAGVARGIAAQYLPRGEWEPALDDDGAAVVSVAEKADSLAAFFSAGEEPTGSADPYGLRRHALGLLRILERKRWPLSPEAALRPAFDAWRLPPETAGRALDFVWARADQEARARGFVDFVEAVGPLTGRPYAEHGDRLEALRALSRRPLWKDLVALVERTGNMGVAGTPGAPPPEIPAEVAEVVRALNRFTGSRFFRDGGGRDRASLAAFAEEYLRRLGAPVHEMFERVLVDDPARPDRARFIKGILHEIFDLFRDRLGDLRRLGSGARPSRD